MIGDIVKKVYPGDNIFIPQGTIHRIENPDKDNKVLRFIEVQLGNSFDEDDIVRYADDYNRV
jgi:mannose-6-phosphate isomerase-like protein (cupin superfamily)